MKESICPGCRLRMPVGDTPYNGYYNTSDECWTVYSEVLGTEFSNALIFSQVHQLTVDTYAVQHTGGSHPDKSVDVHLAGLYLALVLGVPSIQIPGHLQQIVRSVGRGWPHFTPPRSTGPMDISSIAMASNPAEHVNRCRRWAAVVWDSWNTHHTAVAAWVEQHTRLHA